MSDSNSTGLAGFIFSIMALLFGWVPYLGGFLWLLGAVFSCCGLARPPRGFALAGFLVSFGWIIAFLIVGVLAGTMASMTLWPYYMW
ncbi:MAG: hypothetical protein NC336_06465 [Clostridium sp.]|nr:hypothetical protein [Clostridium sp.]